MRRFNIILATAFSLFSQQVLALSGSQISVSNGTGPKFVVGATCSAGPQASYLVINIGNTSSTDTLAQVSVKLTKITGSTSGFKLLAPLADSTVVISRILPSQSEGAYFYVQYPCSDGATVKFNFEISDTSAGVVQDSTTITVSEIQAAGAGGDIKSQVIVGLDALGILVADTVTYEFGNYNGGEIIFQPNGDTAFKANELMLIGSRIVTSAFSACGVPVDTTNVYYFNNGSGCGAGSGNIVKVVYYYINSLFDDTTYFYPFAAMKSGSPVKYSSNYSTQNASFGTSKNSNKVSITKSAGCGICGAGDTIDYTVNISNSATDTIMLDEITDLLPAGYTFVDFAAGSDINESNTSVKPASGESGTITFLGKVPSSVFPYRSYIISQSSSISLKYKVKVKPTSSSELDSNTAIAKVGAYYLDTAHAVTCADCPSLPVSLLNFDAIQDEKGVKLIWRTSSETNSSHFSLFRKTPSSKWEYLGRVNAAGNSQEIRDYSFFDQNPYEKTGTTIYALEQTDFDGTSTRYFARIKTNNEAHRSISLFPNPSQDYVFLKMSEVEDNWQLAIYNQKGQKVYEKQGETISGVDYYPISTKSLGSGLYHVRVAAGGVIQNFTIAIR